MLSIADLKRVKSEKVLPPQLNKLINQGYFGAYRFACYITQYSLYTTIKDFITKSTNDEWVEIEKMYLDDWETRQYSPVFKKTINGIENMKIKKENMKKLLRQDIEEFYEYYKIGI